ncbi:MAG: MobA/MobL family protein [Steroidobacteraceae bacterium]
MAIYYYAMARVGRGGGKGVVASAAYLSRAQYRDEVHGRVYDERVHVHDERASTIAEASHYIGRKGRHGADRDPPLFEGLYGPPGAPDWTRGKENIERFWNEAERAEKHPRAQLAESVIIGLPHELSLQQNVWVLQDHIREFTRQGRVVQLAIHAPDRAGDQRNLHAHLLVSTRGVDEHGMKPLKTKEQQERYLGRSDYLDHLRENWGHVANRHLARHGFAAGLDHRSHERQGSEREAHWHIGPGDMRKERQGRRTRFGDHNRAVAERNAERETIGQEIRHLEAEIIELAQVRAERQKAAEARRDGARSAGGEINREIAERAAERERQALDQEHEARHRETPLPRDRRVASAAERVQEAAESGDPGGWRRGLEQETPETPGAAAQRPEAERVSEAPAPENTASDGREAHRERGFIGRAAGALRRAGEATLDWIAPRVEAPEPPPPAVDRAAERAAKKAEQQRADQEKLLQMYAQMNARLAPARENGRLYDRYRAEREAAWTERAAAEGEVRQVHPVPEWGEWLKREADKGDKEAGRVLALHRRRAAEQGHAEEKIPLHEYYEAEREAARLKQEAALREVAERIAGLADAQRRFYERRFAEERIINPGGPLRHDSMMALMIRQRQDRAALAEQSRRERRAAREKNPVLSWERFLEREAEAGDEDAERELKKRERQRQRERARGLGR